MSEKRATALPDAGTLELVFHAALRAGDAKGIEAALRLLAIQDPPRAEELFDLLRIALAIATDKEAPVPRSLPAGRGQRAALTPTEEQ